MRTPNVFAGHYLDRAAHLRKDTAYVAAALTDPDTLIAPLWRARNLVQSAGPALGAAFVDVTHAGRASLDEGEFILLGRFHGRACFAVDLPGEAPPLAPQGAVFEDLRRTGAQLPEDEAGLLAYARAMVLWRQRHRHCGSCGAPTRSRNAGHVMQCSRAECGAEHFPRLDPAIIVLVTDGERALLGRQAAWPPGRYSTIAGFVEPGESLEDAVAREVLEETGVTVVDTEYHSSQPWPFPSSLMIGFTATAAPGSVPRADEELEDARWFTREQIAAGEPHLPPRQSVSLRLIEHWFDSGSGVPLRETPGWASQGWG